MISSSYEKVMIKILKLKCWRISAEFSQSVLENLQMFGGKEKGLNKGERRHFLTNQTWPPQPSPAQPSPAPWGACGPHGGREPLWQWGPRLTHVWAPRRGPHVASWPPSPLARFLTFFNRILGIRTPILNPFLDYEPWLPHARRRLHNFEKWLRNHLEKRQWIQLNEWERKVA